MSLPTIPDISPKINLDRCSTINLLLSSIALEEIGLSHILNAEGEKLQLFIKKCAPDLHGFLKLNDSVNKTVRTVVKSQLLLQFKLEDVMSLDNKCNCKCDCKCDHKKPAKKKMFNCCNDHWHDDDCSCNKH